VVDLPEFDELPVVEGLGLRHAWNVFGDGDQLGTINLLTPERIAVALRSAPHGRVINLTQNLTAFDPPFYGREPLRHEVYRLDRNYWDDRLDNLLLQSSTHWDGLRHVQAKEFGFWGGLTDESALTATGGPLGIEAWARHGIVGRGVLVDVGRYMESAGLPFDPFESHTVSAAYLDEVCSSQGVKLETGDIICVRTGWMARYLHLDQDGRRQAAESHAFAGLAADEAMSRWLWNEHVAAVAADNPAVEVSPGSREVGSLHRRIVPLLGLAVGELFDFELLARECAAESRWHFLFVSIPLNLVGGVGSPANAIAIR